jgi:hypothetical protein
MNTTERHAILIDAGWTTRADGLMRPPTEWGDRRVYTAAAAWDEHCRREQEAPRGKKTVGIGNAV